MSEPIKVFGNVGSPYTQKILALLRYRNIPYTVSWGDVIHNLSLLNIDPPKPVLLPTMIFGNGDDKNIAKTDTTPIIRELEDEWTTKYMFHYRWHFKEDAENAKKMLVLQHKSNIPDDVINEFADVIADRQINRLWVVGSNDDTAELIDKSYKRFLTLMEKHLSISPFMFGMRPSSADFGLYGQLTQLVGFDPTPRNIAYKQSPRCVSWVNIMSDLSGLHNKGGVGEFFGVESKSDNDNELNYFDNNDHGWNTLENLPKTLHEIFSEVGRVYIPCLIANNKAFENKEDVWEIEIDNSSWKQKTFPYQSKCLGWIKEEFNSLSSDEKSEIKDYLNGTGCELILD